MSKSDLKPIIIGVVIIIAAILIGFVLAPTIRRQYNEFKYGLEKIDEETDYKQLKTVEDTCRAYIASYEADRITYETNKMLESEEAQTLARSAKTRANRTAATYNTYYLQNSYVWKDNIPADIKTELPYLE